MNLSKINQRFRKAMVAAVDDCSEIVAAKMIQNAPEESGALKADIHASKAKFHGEVIKGYALVGDEQIDYAIEQEFGSVHNAPHPFARPAARQTKQQRIKVIKDAARKAL